MGAMSLAAPSPSPESEPPHKARLALLKRLAGRLGSVAAIEHLSA